MNKYDDLYTEDISRASPFRAAYLESVNRVADAVKDQRESKRSLYITPEKLKNNRQYYLDEFKKIIGDPLFDRKKECQVQKMFVACDGQGYIYRLVFTFEKDIKFCGLLFVPFDTNEPLPLVTVVHGGEGTPELVSDMYGKNYYSHITRRILDRRVIVFAPQLLIWDDRKFGNKYDRFETDARFKALGGSLTAFECECIRGALDYLCTMEFVDEGRIGITGLSYGGYYSIITAALDDRINAVYSSCVFNDRIKYSRPDFVYRSMAEKFSDAETAALIYPRALYIEVGKQDGIFGFEGAVSEYEKLKMFYADNSSKLVFKLTETGHKYDEYDDGIDFLIDNIKISK